MPPSGHQKQVANEKHPSQEVTEQKFTSPRPAEKPSGHQKPVGSDRTASQEAPLMTEKLSIPPIPPAMSRPLSAPIVPGPRPAVSVVSMVQTAPVLARSVSAAGRLAPETSAYATTSYVPQSYRNAMMGGPVSGSSSTYSQNHSSNSVVNASHPYSQGPAHASAPLFSPHSSDRMDPTAIKPSLSFGMMSHHDMVQSANLWIDRSQRNDSRNLHNDPNSLVNDMQNLDMNGPILSRSQDHLPSEFPAGTSGRQNHAFQDEFPHLDIINDLLDDEHVGMVARVNSDYYQRFSSGPHINRQYTFPGDPGPGPGPSASSCGIDRTRGYHDDGYQHGYGRNYDSLRDMMMSGPASSRAYGNGLVDSYMTNQWQMGGSDLSGRNMDNDGYPYHIPPEYPNLGVGINGYTVYRPSNGL